MQRGSFQFKIIVVLLTVFVLCGAVMTWFSYRSQTQQLEESLAADMRGNLNLFSNLIASDAEGLARAQAGFAQADGLLNTFAGGDRDSILAAAKPVFDALKTKHNITHMYFIQPDGTVLLRVHKPAQFGDVLKRHTFLESARTNGLASGIEMGKNFFSLRCVMPVSHAGRHLGYLELSQEIDHLFHRAKEITDDDVSVFLTKSFIESKSADIGTAEVGDFVLLDSTSKEIAVQLAAQTDLQRGLQQPTVETIKLGDQRFIVGLGPLKDATGATAGILFYQSEITPLYTKMWGNILTSVGLRPAAAGCDDRHLSLLRPRHPASAGAQHCGCRPHRQRRSGSHHRDCRDRRNGLFVGRHEPHGRFPAAGLRPRRRD
jgi:hypothetical protein